MRRLLVVLALAGTGCPSTPPPACATIETDCAPGYLPTFENVYNNTLKGSCGSTSGSCHSARGRAGDLSFENQQTAYDELLDATQGLVKPGDPSCSELIVRVHGTGEDYQMPPGDELSASHRCALTKWVLDGALP